MHSLALHVFYSQLLDFVTQTQNLIYIFWIHVCMIAAIVEVAVKVQNLALPPRRCSKHGSLSFDDFKQTAFTPSTLSHLLFVLDLTLKSSFSTSTLWKFFLRKDCRINPFSSASYVLTAALGLPACYKTSLFKCFLPFRK